MLDTAAVSLPLMLSVLLPLLLLLVVLVVGVVGSSDVDARLFLVFLAFRLCLGGGTGKESSWESLDVM